MSVPPPPLLAEKCLPTLNFQTSFFGKQITWTRQRVISFFNQIDAIRVGSGLNSFIKSGIPISSFLSTLQIISSRHVVKKDNNLKLYARRCASLLRALHNITITEMRDLGNFNLLMSILHHDVPRLQKRLTTYAKFFEVLHASEPEIPVPCNFLALMHEKKSKIDPSKMSSPRHLIKDPIVTPISRLYVLYEQVFSEPVSRIFTNNQPDVSYAFFMTYKEQIEYEIYAIMGTILRYAMHASDPNLLMHKLDTIAYMELTGYFVEYKSFKLHFSNNLVGTHNRPTAIDQESKRMKHDLGNEIGETPVEYVSNDEMQKAREEAEKFADAVLADCV